MADKKNLMVTLNFYKKQCVSVIIWNEKHLPKQVNPVTQTLEKRKGL